MKKHFLSYASGGHSDEKLQIVAKNFCTPLSDSVDPKSYTPASSAVYWHYQSAKWTLGKTKTKRLKCLKLTRTNTTFGPQ